MNGRRRLGRRVEAKLVRSRHAGLVPVDASKFGQVDDVGAKRSSLARPAASGEELIVGV